MLADQEMIASSWSSLQEPLCVSKYPSTHLRLLSALENGWYILDANLIPSWDQNGFVYRVHLQQSSGGRREEMILPMSDEISELISQYSFVDCA